MSDAFWRGRAIGLMDLDAFFASVEVLDHPEWKGLPVIVGGSSGQRGVVSTCSYEARQFGVHSAMSSAEAERLCPDAIWVSGRMARYHEVSNQVMDILKHETPLVQQVSVDEAFFDITPGDFSKENPIAICKRIQQRVAALGITCSIGLSTSKSVSKIASEIKKPHGFVWVEPGHEREFLAPLPTGALSGVGKRTQERLRLMGIRTLGQLAQADSELLTQMLGKLGAELQLRAQGQERSPVVPAFLAPGPKSLSAERTFTQDLIQEAQIVAAIHHLADKVARRLRAQNLVCSGVTLKLHESWKDHKTAACALHQQSSDGTRLAQAAISILPRLWHEGQPVRLLGIAATDLGAKAPQQLELFSAAFDAGQTDTGSNAEKNEAASGSSTARRPNEAHLRKSADQKEALNKAQDAIQKRFGKAALVKGYDLEYLDASVAYDRGTPHRPQQD